MRKENILKEDGRYLILYWFDEPDEPAPADNVSGDESQQQAAEQSETRYSTEDQKLTMTTVD